MLRLLFRTAVAVLARAFLWMTFSAVLILGAMRYGPTLLAAALPEDIRPKPTEIAKVTRSRRSSTPSRRSEARWNGHPPPLVGRSALRSLQRSRAGRGREAINRGNALCLSPEGEGGLRRDQLREVPLTLRSRHNV
jgi:hypothetical protein